MKAPALTAGYNEPVEYTYNFNVELGNTGEGKEITYKRRVEQIQTADPESKLKSNMWQNNDYEAKIAALQNEFNELAASETAGGRFSPRKGARAHAAWLKANPE